MKLHISGMRKSTGTYQFLWGFYVRGFKPWHHCQPCFRGARAVAISPKMDDGVIDLSRPTKLFYLHGFAGGPKEKRGALNLHLAVRPQPGAHATVQSAFGPTFTIADAAEIPIQEPLAELAHLGADWARCMNLRFAAQVFDAPVLGPTAPRIPVTALKP